jgi:hypothetical protein
MGVVITEQSAIVNDVIGQVCPAVFEGFGGLV